MQGFNLAFVYVHLKCAQTEPCQDIQKLDKYISSITMRNSYAIANP